jgi:hypothetical protein
MTKQKKLFSIKNKENQINMNVDETLYNHFQTLSPIQQKRIQDLMTLKMLQETNYRV